MRTPPLPNLDGSPSAIRPSDLKRRVDLDGIDLEAPYDPRSFLDAIATGEDLGSQRARFEGMFVGRMRDDILPGDEVWAYSKPGFLMERKGYVLLRDGKVARILGS